MSGVVLDCSRLNNVELNKDPAFLELTFQWRKTDVKQNELMSKSYSKPEGGKCYGKRYRAEQGGLEVRGRR